MNVVLKKWLSNWFLNFKYWGIEEHSNQETNIERYHNILSRIEKCYNLISSLNTLSLRYTFSEESRLRFKSEIDLKYANLKKINLNTLLCTHLSYTCIHVIPLKFNSSSTSSNLIPNLFILQSHTPSFPIKQSLTNSVIVISSISIHINLLKFPISKPSNRKFLNCLFERNLTKRRGLGKEALEEERRGWIRRWGFRADYMYLGRS